MRDELPPWRHRYLGADETEAHVYGSFSALRGTFHLGRSVETAYHGHARNNPVQLACDGGLIKFVLTRRRPMSAIGGKADA